MKVPRLTKRLEQQLLLEHRELLATRPFLTEGFARCTDCDAMIEPSPTARQFHTRRCARRMSDGHSPRTG